MSERKNISAVNMASAGETPRAGKEEKVKRNVKDIPPEERKYKTTSENMDKLSEMCNMLHFGNEEQKEAAKTFFVTQYESWAYRIVHNGWSQNCNCPDDLQDMMQAARMGILIAAQNYDPKKGSFCNHSRVYILKELTRESVNRMPLRMEAPENVKSVRRAMRGFEAQQISPTPQMIAHKTNLSLDIVNRVLGYMHSSKIMDLPQYMSEDGQEEGADGWETVPSSMQSWMPEENYEKKRQIRALYQALNSLPYNEKWAVVLYYGMNGESRRTHRQIAEYLSIKLSQVKPLLERGIRSIRHEKGFVMEYKERLGEDNYVFSQEEPAMELSQESMVVNINSIIEAMDFGMTNAG